MTSRPFQMRLTVRNYELDSLGHLHSAVYYEYGEHVRWEFLRAAGIEIDKLLAENIAPVQLESTIRFHRELRGGDEVDVTCVPIWRDGKMFRIAQEYRRPDGTLAAELTTVGGLLDLADRRLLPDVRERFRSLASSQEMLGL
jgi:acyl-CoA thioester hydrolase